MSAVVVMTAHLQAVHLHCETCGERARVVVLDGRFDPAPVLAWAGSHYRPVIVDVDVLMLPSPAGNGNAVS